jgi:hypothetical protein
MATYESRRVGPNEFSFPSYPIQVIVEDYTYEDLIGDAVSTLKMLRVPIEAGVIVLNVMHLVTDDFAGGTSDNIAIGDSGGTEEFSGGTDVAPVEGDILNAAVDEGFGGKYYADADYISVGHNERTAGEGQLLVFYIDKRTNWRTENDL